MKRDRTNTARYEAHGSIRSGSPIPSDRPNRPKRRPDPYGHIRIGPLGRRCFGTRRRQLWPECLAGRKPAKCASHVGHWRGRNRRCRIRPIRHHEGDSPIFVDHRCAMVPAKVGTVLHPTSRRGQSHFRWGENWGSPRPPRGSKKRRSFHGPRAETACVERQKLWPFRPLSRPANQTSTF
jgi:hypothetical protein